LEKNILCIDLNYPAAAGVLYEKLVVCFSTSNLKFFHKKLQKMMRQPCRF